MSSLIEKFGNLVDSKIEKNPAAARKLLLAAYRGKLMQLKHFPEKRLSPARDYMAVQSMKGVIAPMKDPDHAALVNIFMPCELLQAFDIHPMFAEAVASYITGADAEHGFVEFAEGSGGIPETFCSYHKILLGGILSGVVPKPKFIVNTSLACDANNLTFRRAEEYWHIPHMYIDVPYDVSEESVSYVAEQFRELTRFLEDVTGQKLDPARLRDAVARGNRTMQTLQRCQKIKRGRYLSNDLTDELYEVFGTHVLLGKPETEKFAEMLERDLRKAEPDSGIRLLWMHTIPYYQESLRSILNFSRRCQIVSCDMNYDGFYEMDPEKPYESMAGRLVYDSFNGSSDRRIGRSIRMCREQDVDGVVYFCHWGCKQTMAAAAFAKKKIEAAGYPVLILDGDGCDRNNSGSGQMSTRVEAFIEMLEGQRKENHS